MENDKIYFFTASILNWKPILFDSRLKSIIIDSLKFLFLEKAIKIYGFVIMPNHIHLIIMPLDNPKFKNVQLSLMRFISQKIKFYLLDKSPEKLNDFLVNKKDRKYQIWQRNSLATELYSRKIIEQKLDYIHSNPFQGKWMLAESPLDYSWSSYNFYEGKNDQFNFLTHYMDDV